MENNTVNEKMKPEYVQGAAGQKDPTITTAIAMQNNRAHNLKVEVTNSKKPANLPFMIEDGELVEENDTYVVTKAKDGMSREEFDVKKARIEKEQLNSGVDR